MRIPVQDAMTALKEIYGGKMAAIIAEINLDYPEDLLENIQTIKDAAFLFAGDKTPFIGFAVEDDSLEPAGQGVYNVDLRGQVLLVFTDTDPRALEVKLRKYGEAIAQVIIRNRTLDDAVVEARPTDRTYYSGASGSATLGAVRLDVEIECK